MGISKRIGRSMMVWEWGDSEIENPRMLREQLTNIQSKGFSDVLATLCDSRYEVIDPKVVRAAAQASQWAKSRGMMFWFNADPRRASNTLITRTGERLQYLLFSNNRSFEPISLTKVSQGRFEIALDFQDHGRLSGIQGKAPRFEPAGLERVFLFQMEDGQILKDSVIDITGASRCYVNTERGTVEVFGEVGAPDNQEWQVLAFPKFNTDLYDFAGRESTDAMREFVESLFDAAAYVDGMIWDESDVIDDHCFPVSDSMYNSFRVQFGYELRDLLFALVLDVDDGSHILVRHNYFQHLMEILFAAHSDVYAFFHTYFGEIESVLPVLGPRQQNRPPKFIPEKLDAWLNLDGSSVAVGEMSWPGDAPDLPDFFLSQLCLLRSLGAFSKSQMAFAELRGILPFQNSYFFWLDLLSLFSVHWLYRPSDAKDCGSLRIPDHAFEDAIPAWNVRVEEVEKITGYRFPTADTAVIMPIDTLWTAGSEIRDEIWTIFCGFIARLLRAGIQMDVIPSSLLGHAKLTPEGIRIGVRTYRSVVYPYPLVLTPKALDVIAAMDRLRYPVFLGGEAPEFTTTGKRIPHQFPLRFDPESEDISSLLEAGIQRRFDLPEGTLAAAVVNLQNQFVLVMPDRPGQIVSGVLRFEGHEIQLSGLDRLGIFRVNGQEKITKVF